jgi:adenylosuccinate synthase
MPRVIVLTGPVASGKSTLADRLEQRFGALRLSTRTLLLNRLEEAAARDRRALQDFGDRLDAETEGIWLAEAVWQVAGELDEDAVIVVDAPRLLAQIEGLRRMFPRRVVHVHLTAPEALLAERYATRPTQVEELASYEEVRANATEAAVDELAAQADVVIDTARATEDDVFIRAASGLGLTGGEPERLVDVIIGGQFGSEGKGHIAYHLAPEYDVLVRVGGPNAGHRVIWPDGSHYTHRSLPSGALAGQARVMIGPGAVLNVDIDEENLLREIADCGLDVERLAIDPQAMIISADDIKAELELKRTIGSTGQGGGAATARRIISRTGGVQLAGEVPALRPYTQRPIVELLEEAYARGERIMLEGTQGTGLSLALPRVIPARHLARYDGCRLPRRGRHCAGARPQGRHGLPHVPDPRDEPGSAHLRTDVARTQLGRDLAPIRHPSRRAARHRGRLGFPEPPPGRRVRLGAAPAGGYLERANGHRAHVRRLPLDREPQGTSL